MPGEGAGGHAAVGESGGGRATRGNGAVGPGGKARPGPTVQFLPRSEGRVSSSEGSDR
ncbi:hypothetical protein OJF2_46440 [Aquisphaera giovannonii]|uniref:Uncharacterized protein n=1 Tax=Aquisphaera giovannonii TaxID=406548 RepID=A0A5B9W753_9BACT|nr:hypothetical protein OJF2_46440 [Aquisphaera giovannonii]